MGLENMSKNLRVLAKSLELLTIFLSIMLSRSDSVVMWTSVYIKSPATLRQHHGFDLERNIKTAC